MKTLVHIGIGIILLGGLALIVQNSLSNRQAEVDAANAPPAPKLTEPEKIAARKAYAKQVDSQMLDMKIESRTTATGAPMQIRW